MFSYYFKLAIRSFGRNKILTTLMVLAIALGIGAAMTTLTVFKVLSGDPIPQKSDRLFYVQLDPYTKEGYQPGEEPERQLTRFDAEELLRQKKAPRQAMMTGGGRLLPDVRDPLPVRQRLERRGGRRPQPRGGAQQVPQREAVQG